MTPRAIAAALAACLMLGACSREPATVGAAPEVRRLTEEQYRNAIADIFGPDIKVGGRFDQDVRQAGLMAIGTSAATVTPAGLEQFDSAARSIVMQVLDENRRETVVPCRPADAAKADDSCAASFIGKYGRLLLRRPLDQAELDRKLADAARATDVTHDFYAGLQFALAGLLVSPDFVFRKEVAAPQGTGTELDGLSKAARLSFLLWNTTPDDALLTAAEMGELDTPAGLEAQVDRMLASPRLDGGVRAFFRDFLQYELFANLAKDGVIYPKFSQALAADAAEQTLRTITDHLLVQGGDYRDLFTTRRTFMTRRLGMVYRVPVEEDGWVPFKFAPEDRRAGLLTQIGFMALHSHPGRSSATLRGQAIRELLMCQPVAPAPNNVNFTVVQEVDNPKYRTARERLTAHRTDEACAGCHRVVDPIGLALEHFDGLGEYREAEGGAAIDATGELDGAAFADAAGLGRALRDSPATVSCLVDSVYRYAVGRDFTSGEAEWAEYLKARFAADGYRFPALMRTIALSGAFYRVAPTDFTTASQEDSR